ncbi:putative ER membrane protein complex subunit 6 [Blattamonas nauphoetae]|uniref:ER membrane protein complex subunit 6 n=1 Tax=Blattamonas nauphoetae TaxID=2049346 RepID=A0ABQ9XXR4_9EUKA|nr:putative ER membrane protein complex subunit 6 [Blattamonas nauphoetae]
MSGKKTKTSKSDEKKADKTLWQKVKSRDARFTTKEASTYNFWCKIILSLISGTICGIIPITGIIGFAVYVIVLVVGTFIATRLVIHLDPELNPNFDLTELLLSDIISSFALFVLTWTITYTTLL